MTFRFSLKDIAIAYLQVTRWRVTIDCVRVASRGCYS